MSRPTSVPASSTRVARPRVTTSRSAARSSAPVRWPRRVILTSSSSATAPPSRVPCALTRPTPSSAATTSTRTKIRQRLTPRAPWVRPPPPSSMVAISSSPGPTTLPSVPPSAVTWASSTKVPSLGSCRWSVVRSPTRVPSRCRTVRPCRSITAWPNSRLARWRVPRTTRCRLTSRGPSTPRVLTPTRRLGSLRTRLRRAPRVRSPSLAIAART